MRKSPLFLAVAALVTMAGCGLASTPANPGPRPTCANTPRDAGVTCIDLQLDADGKTATHTHALTAVQAINFLLYVTHDGGDVVNDSSLHDATLTIVSQKLVATTTGQQTVNQLQVGSATLRKYDVSKYGAGFKLALTSGEHVLQVNGVTVEGFTIVVDAPSE